MPADLCRDPFRLSPTIHDVRCPHCHRVLFKTLNPNAWPLDERSVSCERGQHTFLSPLKAGEPRRWWGQDRDGRSQAGGPPPTFEVRFRCDGWAFEAAPSTDVYLAAIAEQIATAADEYTRQTIANAYTLYQEHQQQLWELEKQLSHYREQFREEYRRRMAADRRAWERLEYSQWGQYDDVEGILQ